MKNIGNVYQKTNFILGSDELEYGPIFLQSVNLPGISLTHPETYSQQGQLSYASADVKSFNSLNFDIVIDENFDSYFDFMEKVFKNVNTEEGTFVEETYFDLWIVITNLKGKPLFKYTCHNCRIASIGDVDLNTTDEGTPSTFSVEVIYDYYDYERGDEKIRNFFEKYPVFNEIWKSHEMFEKIDYEQYEDTESEES